MESEQLDEKLNAMSPKQVREYAEKFYPDIYHFRRGSKKAMIDKMVTHEVNSEVLDSIARVAAR